MCRMFSECQMWIDRSLTPSLSRPVPCPLPFSPPLLYTRAYTFQIFIFNPNSPDYRRQQLICRADMHVGSHINKFVRWPMPLNKAKPVVRFAAHFATVDGGIGAVSPLSQESYRRLLALQNLLVTAVVCGALGGRDREREGVRERAKVWGCMFFAGVSESADDASTISTSPASQTSAQELPLSHTSPASSSARCFFSSASL